MPAAVASPLEPAALLTEAIVVSDDVHATDAVRFCVELSVYVPVAVNCWVVPSVMLGLNGVIAIDTSVAAVTVNPVEPETAPKLAVIVAVPWAAELANPFEPDALLIDETVVSELLQFTEVVRGCVELSV
jgi:hypothetical protein